MLRPIITAAVLGLGLASAAQAYDPIKQGTCQVFEHKNQKGRSFMLGHGQELIGAPDPGIRTTTNGHSFEYVQFWRPFWNDEIGSAKMSDRCYLTLHEHVDKPGKQNSFVGSKMSLGWWNDEAGRARCRCNP